MKSIRRKNIIIEEPKKTRRDFIKTAWKGLGVVAGLELTGLTIHYLVDRKKSNSNTDLFEAGLPTEFPKLHQLNTSISDPEQRVILN